MSDRIASALTDHLTASAVQLLRDMTPPEAMTLLISRGGLYRDVVPIGKDVWAKLYRDRMRPKPKQCYYNAQRFALFHRGYGYRYAEGWAAGLGMIPVLHAWAVAPSGGVIDHTFDAARRVLRRKKLRLDDPVLYWGIRIPLDLVREVWLREKSAEPLLCRYAREVGCG
jgi:hypothetical protein